MALHLEFPNSPFDSLHPEHRWFPADEALRETAYENYMAVGFKIDYVRSDGDLSHYLPDFILKTADGTIWIVETKGRKELDLPQKMERLSQWCEEATSASDDEQRYDFVFVDQASFEKYAPAIFEALSSSFNEYKQTTAV